MKQEQSPRRPLTTYRFSTRTNSAYKWQVPSVVGAFEVKSEPVLNYRNLKKRKIKGNEDCFQHALKIWEKHTLRDRFIEACDSIPPVTCFCGLIQDNNKSIFEKVTLLNDGWVKHVNKEYFNREGLKLDCYLWKWHNPSGKAESHILMIRFFAF